MFVKTSSKIRLKIIQKMAQATPAGSLPTAETAKTQVVSGSPPQFSPANIYPSIIVAFQTKNIPWIQGLSNLINTSLYYSSGGKVHLPWMRSVAFNFGTDQVPSVDLKNLMNFSKLLYNNIFTNHGGEFKQQLTPEQIQQIITQLKGSQFLNNLSATNPSGQLGTQVSGNVKTLIINYLSYIK